MRFGEFRSGVYRTQLNNSIGCKYKSFYPTLLNQEWSWENGRINVLVEEASRALTELNCFSRFIPNVDVFIEMHIKRESIYSTRIEGTKTELDDLLYDVAEEKIDDRKEVENYIDAINFSIERMQSLPLCNRLLRETHGILLRGVRGEKKFPGEFRISQNWIGGSSLASAFFIPPQQDDLADLMDDLEKFIHNENLALPHLVKAALLHYQFETIHPFCDGNGRLGRLLIILYLINSRMIDRPVLYLSEFFEKNKNAYYNSLTLVRTENELIGWILFFLEGIIETSNNSKRTLEKILDLQTQCSQKIDRNGWKNGRQLLEYLFKKPVVSIREISENLEISYNSANALLVRFLDANLIRKASNKKRGRLFAFEDYIKLFR
ncbi:MAG: Fic family protein [Rickettsiales bacterium]|jgi:Fic family protein|nr:Fic family protein [Rickettsiales bacterium]